MSTKRLTTTDYQAMVEQTAAQRDVAVQEAGQRAQTIGAQRTELQYQDAEIATLRSSVAEARAAQADATRRLEYAIKERDNEETRRRAEVKAAGQRKEAPFGRDDITHLNTEQIRTLADQAIQEARRRGMLEAEGLVSKHRQLNRETDIELMEGLVRSYQDRAAQLKKEKADEERSRQLATKTVDPMQRLAPATLAEMNPSPPRPWWREAPEAHPNARCTCGLNYDFCRTTMAGLNGRIGHTPTINTDPFSRQVSKK